MMNLREGERELSPRFLSDLQGCHIKASQTYRTRKGRERTKEGRVTASSR